MESRVTTDPAMCGGQAVLRGTRAPVQGMLDLLAAGETADSILLEYPQLSREDIAAALQYAAGLAREELQRFDAHG